MLATVVNSTSTNVRYYYHQASTSDYEQQLVYIKAHIIHVTCSWHATDATLPRVTLTPDAVAAPPSGSHLAADLFLRASAHFGVVQEFFISRIHLGHKVLELPVV